MDGVHVHSPTSFTGESLHDFFVMLAIVVPHVVTVVLAILTYLSSKRNSESLAEVKNTLNGKEDHSAESPQKVEPPS